MGKHLPPAVDAEPAQSFDVALVKGSGVGYRRHGALDAGFTEQVQHRIRRSIGVVTDIVGCRAGKLITRVKARDLNLATEPQRIDSAVGRVEKSVVFHKIGQKPWM